MNPKTENRRSFRVSESIYILYETLTEEEFRGGMDHFKLRRGINDGARAQLVDVEARLSEAMYLLNGDHSNMGRCLTLLNEKLNIVVDELPGLRESKASLAQQPPQTCDLSADGLVFSADQTLQKGDKLYVRFLLSSDNRYVDSFCHVVRLTDPPDTSDPARKYGIAVEFVSMPPAQREILIQHMFSRESETLRMRRLQLDQQELSEMNSPLLGAPKGPQSTN